MVSLSCISVTVWMFIFVVCCVFAAISADIVLRSVDGKSEAVIGSFGAVHPEVLGKKAFDVKWPCSAMEINIQGFAME